MNKQNSKNKKNNNKKLGFKELGPESLTLRQVDVVPDRIFLRMRYCTLLVRAPAAAIDGYALRGNSLFDPDFTGVGHQPFGYDQWCLFYARYRVHASKIEVRFVNEGTIGMACAIYPSTSSNLPTNWDNAAEVPRSATNVIGQNTGDDKLTLNNQAATRKIFGFTSINQDDTFSAVTSSNPNRGWYWIITAASSDGLANLTYGMAVTIHYEAELFERLQIGTS